MAREKKKAGSLSLGFTGGLAEAVETGLVSRHVGDVSARTDQRSSRERGALAGNQPSALAWRVWSVPLGDGSGWRLENCHVSPALTDMFPGTAPEASFKRFWAPR